ncbi:hypothetical protein [Pseudomonas sp. Sample_22]|uniref:hypothetical protein n=1 Tax=Pseudomonas sp. Sample_22 TaxID=2448266 RepID=UPI001032DE2E|nr:hypothetical protein [Pseudomonas sp. Sample_22]
MPINRIQLKTGNKTEFATLIDKYSELTLIRKNGFKKTYTEDDLFLCLARMRRDFPETKFLCKGAKLNVYPSRMCSQMSNGAVAYEMILGEKATRDHIVHIFDFDDENIAQDIFEQEEFQRRWMNSF